MNDQDETRFEFGKNWASYVEHHFNAKRTQLASDRLLQMLEVTDLQETSLLDIGCGSGLHSLAARVSGANPIVSFDYDPVAVETAKRLRNEIGDSEGWTITRGSVLDEGFMASLPKFDVVYSWGVLHHTGDVWGALDLAIQRVAPGGKLFIALYAADVQINPGPEFWLDIKRRYNAASSLERRRLEAWYVWRFGMGKNLRNLPMVLRNIRDSNRDRGMDYLTDVRDWLGGWPMEFVWDRDVVEFCQDRGLAVTKVVTGEACSEYVFSLPIEP